ncbi:Hypothetical predicted protein [Podarcis lilfordi]|uniref:Uncharacterized protein n=1 Tax=Podarcis lilfordi TaxID=74358 RepID=A0AA35K3R2_9SAUR|nr:Hypothetical predicted protein [Podarcis lilfordi]
MSFPSQVLLAICVFLFLTPGDALLCAKCLIMIPGVPCNHQTCEVDDGGTCVGITTLENGVFRDKILDCGLTDMVNCDMPCPNQNDICLEVKCCDDSDFCNANF